MYFTKLGNFQQYSYEKKEDDFLLTPCDYSILKISEKKWLDKMFFQNSDPKRTKVFLEEILKLKVLSCSWNANTTHIS